MAEQTGRAGGPRDDASRLGSYVETWWSAVQDVLDLAADVRDPAAWAGPTRLPGWSAHDVLAHLAHLETLAAGGEHTPVEIGEAPHVRDDFGRFMEEGVAARRDRSPDELVAELRESTRGRREALLADPPADAAAPAPGVFGALGWNQETFLSNRPLDVWLHDQDLRAALGAGGGHDSLGAAHSVEKLLDALPFVLGKRVGASPGTVVRVEVDGHAPRVVRVHDDGRARPVDPGDPDDADADAPTASLRADRLTFTAAAGGRADPAAVPETDPARAWRIDGDHALARRLIETLAVTP